MADIEHKDITEANLHEPKGISAALAGAVLQSDGAGSGSWVTPTAASGVYIYEDVTTASTAIPLTLANTWYDLTNDGAGSATDTTYAISGTPNIWNTTTNRLDLSGLPLGTLVSYRVELDVTQGSPNVVFDVQLEVGLGGVPETSNVLRESRKSAGLFESSALGFLIVNTTNRQQNPARFQIRSDSTGDTVRIVKFEFAALAP